MSSSKKAPEAIPAPVGVQDKQAERILWAIKDQLDTLKLKGTFGPGSAPLIGGAGGGYVPGTGGSAPGGNFTAPPVPERPDAPTGLSATAIFGAVILEIDQVPYGTGYLAWYSAPEDDLSLARQIGTSEISLFKDYTGSKFKRYYWVQAFGATVTHLNSGFNQIAGTPATPGADPDDVIGFQAIRDALIKNLAANKIVADQLSVISENAGDITAGTFRTGQAPNLRAEMSSIGAFPFWIGSGDKTQGNALFYTDTNGNSRFNGTVELSQARGAGNLASQDTVQYGQVENRPKTFRLVSVGYHADQAGTAPVKAGIYDDTGNALARASQSWLVGILDRRNRSFSGFYQYDLRREHGGSSHAAAMADRLNATGNWAIVFIVTYGRPNDKRLTHGMPGAMYRCGASRAIYHSDHFASHGAYILAGIPGIGEGNGLELYNGHRDDDSDGWVETAVTVNADGSIQLGRINARDAIDIGYADGDTVEGLKPGEANADRTRSNTANDTDKVAGEDARVVRDQASEAGRYSSRVRHWTRPSTTKIDGNQIYTGDAYVDTLQIKGRAVTIPYSKFHGSHHDLDSGYDRVCKAYNIDHLGNGDNLLIILFGFAYYAYAQNETNTGDVSAEISVEAKLKSGGKTLFGPTVVGSGQDSAYSDGRGNARAHAIAQGSFTASISIKQSDLASGGDCSLYAHYKTSDYNDDDNGNVVNRYINVLAAQR